jgi:mono/diheme cytochrome c family protein
MARRIAALAVLLWIASFAVATAQGNAWTLPASAATEKNPVAVDAATLAAGRRLFRENCARCHGPQGKGNGSDADPKHRHHMDLTRADADDAEGILFHKIWNGRDKPKMPAFKDKLTKEQVWTLVAFAQSLREKS